ncbi:squalene synthase HpnC [Ottowia sp.]|uniref:squalene synthase HpnC n=1 Tax=Ottowia sp. TaxID=1898956 RepID=UPI002BE5A9AF|nr:squalene synthase HpnC [Ottowia sp.]
MPPSQRIEHYENFPVASWLCPPRLRAPIAAIYHFARTADDLADEGDAGAAERLAALADYRRDLHAAAAGRVQSNGRWPQVFGPLAAQIRAFALPLAPLEDLLSAFEQDVVMTQAGAAYPDMAALLDYCRRSANPIGRLLLHLYGVQDAASLQQSDAICTALQLINFWQDLSVDIPRGRYYLPLAECTAHGIAVSDPSAQFGALRADEKSTKLIAACAHQARETMLKGTKLVHRIPGRAGWELRAVVQGGLRVLDKVEAMGAQALLQRPRLHAADAPAIVWRMLRM